MLKYSAQQLLSDLGELQVGTHYKYVKLQGGNVPANECIFQGVDVLARTVSYSRLATPEVVDVVSPSTFDVVAHALLSGLPCNLDVVLLGGGNNRSIFEALLANTRHVFACQKNRRKHIILVPSKDHPVGEIAILTDAEVESAINSASVNSDDVSWQTITYGAPGTGKSHQTDLETKGKTTFRTTFHPDSDYSTFVGSYKPTKAIDPYETVVKVGTQNGGNIIQQDRLVRKSEISYDFVPQAFIRAYVAAWKKYAARVAAGGALTDDDRVYLVIEEINRGHCAQIFGDLFQLLDRNEAGFSDYPIDADVDLAKWLRAQFVADDFGDEFKAIKGYEEDGKLVLKLCLPPNLFIRATMNTSDQSLFPMDSAFKRRWDWRYVPISEPDSDDEPDFNKRKVLCKLGGENKLERRFDWWEFLKVINAAILDATKSEDKQLGYFFVKVPNDPGEISAEKFAGKVLFYLYNDVFKDYNYPDAVFAKKNQPAGGPKVKYAFKDFFDKKGRAKDAAVAEFLENLGVPFEEKQLPV